MQMEGITRFFILIDAGIGLYTSELVVSLMETDKELLLYCLIPYEEQTVKWSPELQNRYYSVLEKCTEPVTVPWNGRRPVKWTLFWRQLIGPAVSWLYAPGSR